MTRRFHAISAILLIAYLVSIFANRQTAITAAVQQENSKRESIRIGVIDVSRVFESSDYFIEQREELKEKINKDEAAAKEMFRHIKQLTDALPQLTEGSEEHAKAANELKQKQTEFESYRKETQGRILNLESKIYKEVRQSLLAAVKVHAETENLDIVLTFDENPLNDQTPEKLMEGLRRTMLYRRKEFDVTDDVVAILNNSDR